MKGGLNHRRCTPATFWQSPRGTITKRVRIPNACVFLHLMGKDRLMKVSGKQREAGDAAFETPQARPL